MKNTILAATIFSSFLSVLINTGGSVSYAALQAEGQELSLR